MDGLKVDWACVGMTQMKRYDLPGFKIGVINRGSFQGVSTSPQDALGALSEVGLMYEYLHIPPELVLGLAGNISSLVEGAIAQFGCFSCSKRARALLSDRDITRACASFAVHCLIISLVSV